MSMWGRSCHLALCGFVILAVYAVAALAITCEVSEEASKNTSILTFKFRNNILSNATLIVMKQLDKSSERQESVLDCLPGDDQMRCDKGAECEEYSIENDTLTVVLRKAILNSSYVCQLVPPHPNDAKAECLLETKKRSDDGNDTPFPPENKKDGGPVHPAVIAVLVVGILVTAVVGLLCWRRFRKKTNYSEVCGEPRIQH